ncbi:MAG TPA: helix-turn-helix domain-containing protein [Chloroflexia bacterium]|nr:helix-turn-helix domain-containing protein [Chloroflexia bacterium]
MSERLVKLNDKDRERLEIVRRVATGALTVKQAAESLGVSERQMYRIVAAYRERRLAGLAHGNRGRRPASRLPDEVRARVAELARTKYAGESQHRFQQLLAENEGIRVSRSTVRNILIEAELTRRKGSLSAGSMAKQGNVSQIAGEPRDRSQAAKKHLQASLDEPGSAPGGGFR